MMSQHSLLCKKVVRNAKVYYMNLLEFNIATVKPKKTRSLVSSTLALNLKFVISSTCIKSRPYPIFAQVKWNKKETLQLISTAKKMFGLLSRVTHMRHKFNLTSLINDLATKSHLSYHLQLFCTRTL